MIWAAAKVFSFTLLIGSIGAATHHKIIGGHDTVIKKYPCLVSFRLDGKHFCGGSIISDRHILTAAHCVEDFLFDYKDNVTIHSGTSNTGKEGTVHKILSLHIHPSWDSHLMNDIAVVTLKDSIAFNKYQQKVNLPSHDVENYQVADLVGWGRMSREDKNRARQLQKLQVALLPSDKCKPLITHEINSKQLCSFRSVTRGACHGDSGGPLISKGEVVGIVSYGDTGICADGALDVYTNVFANKDFIESAMNE